MDVPKGYSLGIMMKVVTNSKINQNLLKYWFPLQHFAIDDPVVVLEKKKKEDQSRVISQEGFYCTTFSKEKSIFLHCARL